MTKFRRIAILDRLDLSHEALSQVNSLSEAEVAEPIGDPSSPHETVQRLGDADGALVSWRTKVPQEVLDDSQLRFIGLCASAYADPRACNIDLSAAERNSITVSSFGQWADEATAEFVLLQMLSAARNQTVAWRAQPVELFGKRLGIIGLGHMGHEVAERASAFGMHISYTGPHPKSEAASLGYEYMSKPELLKTSDIISVHVPKGTAVLSGKDLGHISLQTLLINTSIGPTVAPDPLARWLTEGGSAICDMCVDQKQRDVISQARNGYVADMLAYDTIETHRRKASQIFENLECFLAGSPVRVISGH